MLSVVCLTLLTSACLSFQYPIGLFPQSLTSGCPLILSCTHAALCPQILSHLRAGLFLTHCVEHESRTQVYFSAYKGHKQWTVGRWLWIAGFVSSSCPTGTVQGLVSPPDKGEGSARSSETSYRAGSCKTFLASIECGHCSVRYDIWISSDGEPIYLP